MSNKLAKVSKNWHKGGKKLAKAAKKAGAKEAGLGKTGHRVIQTLGGIGAGLVTKNVGPIQVPFTGFKVAPDTALTALAGGLYIFGKSLLGGKAKWVEDAMWSGINAIAGRYTWTGQLIVHTDKGEIKVKQGMPEPERQTVEQPRDVNARVTMTDDGRPVVEVQTKAA